MASPTGPTGGTPRIFQIALFVVPGASCLSQGTKQEIFEHTIEVVEARHSVRFDSLIADPEVDVNADMGWPLVLASSVGNIDAMTKLLHAGANAGMRREHTCATHTPPVDRPTAVYAAASRGNLAALRLLLAEGGRAVSNVSVEAFTRREEKFINPDLVGTALQAAAIQGHRLCVEELLLYVDVNAMGKYSYITRSEDGDEDYTLSLRTGTALEALVEKLANPFGGSVSFPVGLEIVKLLGRAGANDESIANCRALLLPYIATHAELRELDRVLAEKDFAEAPALPAGAVRV